MPLVVKPAIATISTDKKGELEYAISFVYNFNGDSIIPISIAGGNFTGAKYNFSAIGLPNSPANLPRFRTMQFTQTFNNLSSAVTAGFDGELIVSLPTSGQIIKIGSPIIGQDTVVGPGLAWPKSLNMTGVIPIIANHPTQIDFYKLTNEDDGSIGGVLTVTLSTKEYAPYLLGSVQR